MKKIGFLLVLGLLLASCGDDTYKKNKNGLINGTNSVNIENIKNNYDVIVIEGCEYIVYSEEHGYGGYAFMAHKGNCNNPIHRHEQ